MEALESDFDLNSNKSHMKCSLNNDVSKQVNNSVVNSLSNNNNNNINNNINHFKENNNFQNNSNKCHLSEESIECIQLEDESDDEPPNKMARLSARASPERSGQVLQSLPSPPQSPLTSTQPFTEENEMEVNFVKQNNENNSENEDNLVETKICGNCFDRNECNRSECNRSECNGCESDSTQRNTNVDINSKSSIDNKHNVSTIETNNTFTKSEPNISVETISVETISVETCVETNNENKSSLELSLKRLIAVCLEKRLQTFSQNFQLEVELSEKLDSFKCESIQRNNQLIELKRHKNGFIDKQIQVDFGLNDIPINERQQKCSKAGTECLVLKNDNKSQSKEEYSLLKEHLMTQNDTNNCIESDVHLNDKTISLNEPKLKNGLNPKLKEVLNNNQNVLTNNLRISESKALPKPQTNYSNNCDNSSDECEVVTIESDDEESKESIDVLKPSGVSWKSSKSDYNEALPSPKLSVSYSKTSNKANPSNHSVVSKGQNPSATERKSNCNLVVSPTEIGRQSFDPNLIELD